MAIRRAVRLSPLRQFPPPLTCQLFAEVLFHDLGTISSRNTRDDMTEAETEYGPRAGLPRLLRLFKQFGYTATVDAGESKLLRKV